MILGQFVVTTISYVYSRGSPVHVAATTERGEMTERDASSTQLWRIKKKKKPIGRYFFFVFLCMNFDIIYDEHRRLSFLSLL